MKIVHVTKAADTFRRISLFAVFGLAILFIQSQSASAQWTTNGNNINNTNSGNVGVNTASPTTRLHVFEPAGNGVSARVTIQDADSSAGFNLFAVNKSWSFVADNSPDGFSITSTGGANFFIGNTGNVGIGTTAPVYSLDVNGAVNAFRAKASTTNWNDTIATFENSSGISAIIRANGNVGIGTTNPANKLHVAGSITVDGNINAKYQDVAEWVPAAKALPPGTVVTLNRTQSNLVEASSKAYDTRVAGVISEQPGIALGERGENKVLVATTGRVRIKVDASREAIEIGDLLVTSEKEGVAMKSVPVDIGGTEIHRPGTLIGKALEPLAKGQGEILVLLSLQ